MPNNIEPMRVAVFGSYYRGLAVVDKILELQEQNPEAVKLVGIATDDPLSARVSPKSRLWQYVTDTREHTLVVEKANENNVPVWTGSIKEDSFYQTLVEKWKPDIIYVATFGQRIQPRVFDYPRLGTYNFHPCVDSAWPSYVGGNPLKAMLDVREPHCAVAMHVVDEQFDHGRLVAFSHRVPIELSDTVLSLHKKTVPETARMVEWHLSPLLGIVPRTSYRPQVSPPEAACA